MSNVLRHPLAVIAALAVTLAILILTGSIALAVENSTDIASHIQEQQQSLEQSKQELFNLDIQIQEQERAVEQQRTQLADATTLLSEAEDRYHTSMNLFNNRVTSIYKMGSERFYELLLTSDGLSDALSRLYYLGIISEQDSQLLEKLKAEEAQVRTMRNQVDLLKQTQAGSLEEMKSRHQQLTGQIVTGQVRIDTDAAELAIIQQRERDQEEQRQAQAAAFQTQDFTLYSGVMGPSLQVSDEPPPGLKPTGAVLIGQASWYGPGFNGRTTANGEIYNMFAMTAAHKSLPFGTWLKVTYNGRSVFVRINDRGPYVGGRILDLSAVSAQAIGLSGVGSVTAEIFR